MSHTKHSDENPGQYQGRDTTNLEGRACYELSKNRTTSRTAKLGVIILV